MTAPTRTTSIDRDAAATGALALFSLSVAFGFARVFSGWDFLWQLGAIVALGHGLSFALRRARVSGWITVPGVLLVLLWTTLALRYADTMTFGVPTDATWRLLDLELGVVRDSFPTTVAPVIYSTGWATLALFAMVVVVTMSDAFAFRAEARGEALVPGGVLFVFIAALGDDRLRVVSTALLIASGIVAVIALRSLHDRSRRVELTSGRTTSFAVPAAVASAVVVALLAGFIGPRIPGAGADPLYDTRGRGGDSTLLSPLVDIRPRLTNRGNVELFRVNADAPAYWRVASLAEFDGRRFTEPRRDVERSDDQCDAVDGPVIRQQVQIVSLSGRLVPAAVQICRASGVSAGEPLAMKTQPDTGSLLAPTEMLPGDLFTVDSLRLPRDPATLRSASVSNPPDPIFTDLPDDLPDVVAETAREVTAGAATPFDQAIALQTWFREFDYSTEVNPGHGSNEIEVFLQQRIGYCEQFSATFAAMARTLGIPSRVAVGFTPGLLNDDGWYVVLGKNAHAWPELWFDGIGWVSFEPTPGRGEPGATAYTNLDPAQDESGQTGAGGPDGGGVLTVPTTPSTVVAPSTTIGDGTTATTLPSERDPSVPLGNEEFPNFPGEDGATAGSADSGSSVPWRAIIVFGLLVVLLALPELLRRVRRRSTVLQPSEQRVTAAWQRARTAAQRAGVRGTSAMTATEWADATADQLPVAARPMASLADVVDRVQFAPPGSFDLERAGAYGSTLRHDCELWSHQVGRIARDRLTTRQRLHDYFFAI